ncbi:MAG: tetratricopeptide repeat protein [Planctomycetota bacterium]|nr:tetratricopeptide repeat protein [Planctomycetota bacterium]
MATSRFIWVLGAAAAAAGLGVLFWQVSRMTAPLRSGASKVPTPSVVQAATAEPVYVGRSACAECHKEEDARWQGSHHDLAMQIATPETVLGDFTGVSYTYHETTTTFTRKDDAFFVRTDGPDGALHDYKVAYTFGIYPLQQYLIELPGGRYQALNVCWDARPADQGGQKWFHLYPAENVTSDDILHWTGPYQNWNHMCAECHSTNVHKKYDAATATFATSYSEIDVSCEACHGPGSAHVAWGHRAGSSRNQSDPQAATKGLVAMLREPTPGYWKADAATGIAKRSQPLSTRVEVETCARCHSRRSAFKEDAKVGDHPLQTHRIALLEPDLYETDGQIKDEVFEYGSFVQSRMHAVGVTCTDCHDPHSLKTPPGNNACAKCHSPEKFDTAAHHFHTPATPGSMCVDCHMPTRNYMVVHARHDHSLRVPRPDLSTLLGTPNACNGCHSDKTPQWAAREVAKRTPGKATRPNFGQTLDAARKNEPGAESLLAKLVLDASQPAIARATAATMLEAAADQSALVTTLRDPDPLLRAAAASAVGAKDGAELIARLGPLLSDPVRQVRIDAVRRLAAAPDSAFSPDQQNARAAATKDFLDSLALDADRAESHLNLGMYHAQRGDAAAAERSYRTAIALSPRFPGAYVNLGDLYRGLGREQESLEVLREGVEKSPWSADLPHALGLALVRAGKHADALPLLDRAWKTAPQVVRYGYVYGVALESSGPPGNGVSVLRQVLEKHPNDIEVLSALVYYCGSAGLLDEAITHAERLAKLVPNDPQMRRTVEELKAQRARNVPRK